MTRGAILVVAVGLLGAGATPAEAALSARDRLSTAGLGPVRIGMTIRQAERAAGRELEVDRNAGIGGECFTGSFVGGPRGVYVLGTGSRVAVVGVSRGSRIRTRSGIRIGTPERVVRRRFGRRLRVTLHPYAPEGRYLIVVPRDRAERNRRVIFETDGRRVTLMRAGRLPEVRYIEGCA